MVKKTLKRAAIGFLIGMFAGNLIAFIFGISTRELSALVSDKLIEICGGSEMLAFVVQTLVSGFLGAASCAGMTFYEIESWSMVKTMIVHFATISAVYIPAAFLMNWVETLEEILLVEVFMLIGYIITWFIFYLIYKSQVRKLNELQQEKSEKTEKDKK